MRAPIGEGVYRVKPYDPRFLSTLGILQRLKDLDQASAKAFLTGVHLLLNEVVIKNGANLGLRKAPNYARMIATLAQSVITDQTVDIEQDRATFDTTKQMLLMFFDQFEHDLSSDVDALYIYVLEEKRGYSIDVLLGKIEEALPPDDRGTMSDFARDNMQESGTCLLFHRFTACGYHMARAVEDVARRYYSAITGRPAQYTDKNGDLRHRMLGQIAQELQDVLNTWKGVGDPGLLPLLVPTLRQFCRIYRNPLSHADPDLKELGPNEAEVAFGHGIAAVSTMLEDGRAGGAHFKSAPKWS